MSIGPTQGNGVHDGMETHVRAGNGARRDAPRSRIAADRRSIPDLLRELSGEGAELVRQEVALGKAEMSEKIDLFKTELTSMAVGGAFLLSALLFSLWALNLGLIAILGLFMALETAVWVSPLILAGVLAVVGISMTKSAAGEMKREGIAPSTTRQTLENDKQWVQNKARHVKEEMTHG